MLLNVIDKVIRKPYIAFFISGVIPLILGFKAQGVIDINIHDTYYVISRRHLTILYSIAFGLIGFSYFIAEKVRVNLSYNLNLIHLIITFGGINMVLILNHLMLENSEIDTIAKLNFSQNLYVMIYFIIIGVVIGQIILPINIIRGISKTTE